MKKGILKNKILTAIAITEIFLTAFFTLCGGAGKVHVYTQKFNRDHLEESSYLEKAEYVAAVEDFNKEVERVEPIANGMLITAGANFVVGSAAVIGLELDRKKRKQNEELAKEVEIENGFAGTL
ncbi:MAG: hypothetical protein J6K97_02200 [Clostridia bacterium]|nr:hypothetical protein [Clostridia bacterium]